MSFFITPWQGENYWQGDIDNEAIKLVRQENKIVM